MEPDIDPGSTGRIVSIASRNFCRKHRRSFAFVTTWVASIDYSFESHQRRLWRCPDCWKEGEDRRLTRELWRGRTGR